MKKNVSISEELYNKIQERVNQSDEFKTVEEYVEYVLEEVIKDISNKKDGKTDESEKQVYSKEDEEKVKERLRGLGYLD